MPFVNRHRQKWLFLTVGLIIAALPWQAQALSNCGLSCSCTISTSSIALTGYNPIAGQAVTGTGSLTVSCQLLVSLGAVLMPYSVGLSKGQSNSYAARQMAGPTATNLAYNLYSDPAMTAVWGDGTGISQVLSNSITLSILNLLVPQIQTIYAQIPAGQNVPLGTYNDTVTATLSF